MVTYKRHIRDMSSMWILCIEPWEITKEICGRSTKIAMFAFFRASKNVFFHLFFKFSHFKSKFQKTKKRLEVWTNPIFCTPDCASWSTGSTLNSPLQTDKKKLSHFLLVWWRHLTECHVPYLCQIFFMKQFFQSFDVFQRNRLKPIIIAHWPTL